MLMSAAPDGERAATNSAPKAFQPADVPRRDLLVRKPDFEPRPGHDRIMPHVVSPLPMLGDIDGRARRRWTCQAVTTHTTSRHAHREETMQASNSEVGTWKLNFAKSKFNQSPAPKRVTISTL